MRTLIAIVAGLAGGFVLGLLVSQIIGIAGLLLVQQVVGIKYLPIYTAIVGAVVAPIVDTRRKREA